MEQASVSIRPVEERDLEEVSDLLCRSYEWLGEREQYNREQIQFLLEHRGSLEVLRRESAEQRYFAVCLDGAILGLVTILDNEVTKLYVDPAHHRQGIGAMLLRLAEQLIAEQGFNDILLVTTPGSAPFYVTMGMSIAERKQSRAAVFHDREALLMRRDLTQDRARDTGPDL